MKILVIPDKFKGSLSSAQVSAALSGGIKSVLPEARIVCLTASDGGEGFLKAVGQSEKLRHSALSVPGPLGTPHRGYVGLSKDGRRAYIESCQATGFHWVPPRKRNPFKTSSGGLAALIARALSLEPREIYIGLGSSATCDAGIPAAIQWGYRFLDKNGKSLDGRPGNFSSVREIRSPAIKPWKKPGLKIYAVSDVINPPFGKNGAIRIYTPQKGASPRQVRKLEKGLRNLVLRMERSRGENFSLLPGAGAAGCLALGIHYFFGARIIQGSEFIFRKLDLEKRIHRADAVITGEGSFDLQSFYGKIAGKIIRSAQNSGKRIFLVTGRRNIPAVSGRQIDGSFSVEALVKKGGNSTPDESIEALRTHGKAIGNILKSCGG